MTLNEIQQKVILLEISQYIGFPHLWGKLVETRPDGEHVETDIRRRLGPRAAAERNRREGFLPSDKDSRWQSWMQTGEFDTEKQLFRLAKKVFLEIYESHYDWLVVGRTNQYPPYRVLIAPAGRGQVMALNSLWKEAEKIGWCNNPKNDRYMDQLEQEWIRLFKEALL